MRKLFLTFFLIFSSFIIFAQNEDSVNFQVLTGYYGDYFNQPYTRNFHVFYVGAGLKMPNTSIYGKVNYGYLSPESGLQFELDYYQRLTKTTTSWWNYAYSANDNFPGHRAMFRIWQELGAGFLISGGLQYFYFDKNLFTANIGLEKYLGRFWVEGLAYFHFKEPDIRMSYQLNSRFFWQDYNYVQLSLRTGAAQDEPWVSAGALNSHSVGLSVVTYVNKTKKLQLRAGVGYAYEEYSEDLWRNRYTTAVGLVYTFKGGK